MSEPTTENQRMRHAVYSWLDLPSAGALLDVGCGDGHDLAWMGGIASRQTRLVGVDSSAGVLAKARQKTESDDRYAFVLADVSQGLPFGDARFEIVFSNNVLECLPDKAAFVREMHRVLKPHGQMVCAHFDMDTQLFDGDDKALVRQVVHAFADWKQDWMADVDGWMGRRLWRTIQPTGLFEGRIETRVLTETRFEPGCYGYEMASGFAGLVRRGRIAPEEYRAFLRGLRQRAAQNAYFYSITLYVYIGRKC